MKSPIQSAMLVALASILKPIAKLILQSGLGYSEFIEVAKSVFVHVAAEDCTGHEDAQPTCPESLQ